MKYYLLFAFILITFSSFNSPKPETSWVRVSQLGYPYEEDNWVDDMELGAAAFFQLPEDPEYYRNGLEYGKKETSTPWMGADTARHYQWYPFIISAILNWPKNLTRRAGGSLSVITSRGLNGSGINRKPMDFTGAFPLSGVQTT